MGRRPDLFAEPDRFDPSHSYGRRLDAHAWNPLGGGVRMCTGRGFAEFETLVVLAALIQNVDLRLADAQVRAVRSGFFFAPSDGLRVRWNRPTASSGGARAADA